MFICMQKIKFIYIFFFEILQRHFKLAILGTLGMLDHPHQNHSINLYQALMLIWMQKINFITHFSLKILQKNSKPAILCTLGMPGYANAKWYYHLVENIRVYLQAKNEVHSPRFSGDIAKISKLIILGTLSLVTHTINYSIN